MRLALPFVILAAALAVPGNPADGPKQTDAPKQKKPKLDLRATPRMAFSPVNVLLTAELTGGDDVEEYYCPELEWDWDDGGKSVHEADCPEYEAGVSKIERRFTAEHEYGKAGLYNVKLTMRRANRTLAQTTIKITVRPGLGDRSMESPQP
jgi:PKD repeat protein